MRAFDQELVDEIRAEAFSPCCLIEMEFSSTYRFTDCDLDVYYGGNWYLSRGFEPEGIFATITPELDSLGFDIDNVDQTFNAMAGLQELRNRVIKIYLAVLDSSSQVIKAQLNFQGVVDQIDIDNKRARFDLLNYFYNWNRFTQRKHPSTCAWLFKGAECSYSGGETWCDKSYDRCGALSNTDQFGGFRFLPDLQDKEISWGRTVK